MHDNFVEIATANKDFLSVVKKCDEQGKVIIFSDNKPAYILKSISDDTKEIDITDDEKIDIASKRVLKKYYKAFEELAKWLRLIMKK